MTAREIHRLSRRAREPFVSVDLGAVPDSLFESELFGHKRGAFTGADADRAGRVVAANGGTLFLDEIGNLPLHLQRKLLTVLERREVVAVGAVNPTPIDIRLITATNRSSSELEDEGVLRQDLLFRIRTVEITLPPLRRRPEDIPALLEHFLSIYARKYDAPRRKISADALALLEKYAWPGNVRELRNVIERALILEDADVITTEYLPGSLLGPKSDGVTRSSGIEPLATQFVLPTAGISLDQVELAFVQQAIQNSGGNQTHAAELLGISRDQLRYRLKKLEDVQGTVPTSQS